MIQARTADHRPRALFDLEIEFANGGAKGEGFAASTEPVRETALASLQG